MMLQVKNERELQQIQKKVNDVLVREKYPDIADEIRILCWELPKLRKRITALENVVGKLWAEKLHGDMKPD